MQFLHGQKEMSPELLREPEVVQFIEAHASVLNQAVDEGIKEVPPADITIARLKESNFIFSGFKTFHEMNEAFPSLVDDSGHRKSFDTFLSDVQKVNETYNKYYLNAEYNFAVQSSLSAARWEHFSKDGDKYNLRYQTVGDERVRISHRMLDGITLPMSSPFWDSYFPPNGWGCRCNVIQVRKKKYPVSDETEAMNLGSQATAGRHREMFMFNPGKRQAVFGAYNPYTVKKCSTCAKNKLKLGKENNELCDSCKIIHSLKENKKELSKLRAEIKAWAKENLVGKTVFVDKIQNPVEFTMSGIKEILNQSHKKIFAKNRALKDIIQLLQDGEHVKEVDDQKNNPMVSKYHYIKIIIDNEDSYAVIRELVDGKNILYSIVDKIRNGND